MCVDRSLGALQCRCVNVCEMYADATIIMCVRVLLNDMTDGRTIMLQTSLSDCHSSS